MCPKLVVTARVGKEDSVKRELEDLFYKLDPSVRVEKTSYRDVILVFSTIDQERLFEEIMRRPPYTASRVIKIDTCTKSNIDDIVRTTIDICGKRLRRDIDRVRVECIKRGTHIESCRTVEIAVGISIERMGIAMIDLKNPSRVIKIEIMGDKAYIGIMRPGTDRVHRNINPGASFYKTKQE